MSLLEKEKEALEGQRDLQLEELKKDKTTLREFLAIEEKTIDDNAAQIKQLETEATEAKVLVI